MNREQEEKCNTCLMVIAKKNPMGVMIFKDVYERAWKDCLDANGIESNRPIFMRIFESDEKRDAWVREHVDPDFIGSPKPIRQLKPEGFFRIGENVEFRWTGKLDDEFRPATICMIDNGGGHIYNTDQWEVRRPVWHPKPGDPVLVSDGGVAWPAVASGPETIWSHGTSQTKPVSGIKPFDSAKIGLPWDQV